MQPPEEASVETQPSREAQMGFETQPSLMAQQKVTTMKFSTAATETDNSECDLSTPSTPVSHRKRSRRQKSKSPVVIEPTSESRLCLEQAEVCREQARMAARLKRWKAAQGLFYTAIGLCQRALGSRPDLKEQSEAQEYLQELTSEISTYSELAKSMERPLMTAPPMTINSTPVLSNAAPNAVAPTMPLAATTPSFSDAGRRFGF